MEQSALIPQNVWDWLVSLCGDQGLEIVGPSRHRPDAFTVIEVTTRLEKDLWIVDFSPLDASDLCRFEDLLAVTARLSHPHLVAIYGGGVHEDWPYLLVQHFVGRTLGQCIRDQPLPVTEAVELAITLARAVHFVHEAGLVQLDLVANEVLLVDDKTPVIDLRRTLGAESP